MRQIISFIYENPPAFNKNELLYRKKSIQLENNIIYNVSGAGVTSLIFLFLSEFSPKSYLYINLKNMLFRNIDFKELIKEVDIFVRDSDDIFIVVIENCPYALQPILRESVYYIMSMNISLSHTKNEYEQKFKIQCLYPLDFEEYILFTKHTEENIFNSFIKTSTFANILKNNTSSVYISLQDIINTSLLDYQEKEIFLLYLKYQGMDTSVFQLYNRIQKNIKISKDKFYEKSNLLEQKGFLFLLKKYNQERASKKTYFIDFNMPKAVQTTINIKANIKNAILLELIKRDINANNIYYADELDFYIPHKQQAIVLMIFQELENIEEHIWYLDAMLDYKKNELNNVMLITIDEQSSGYKKKIKNIEYEVVTFWEFATR